MAQTIEYVETSTVEPYNPCKTRSIPVGVLFWGMSASYVLCGLSAPTSHTGYTVAFAMLTLFFQNLMHRTMDGK